MTEDQDVGNSELDDFENEFFSTAKTIVDGKEALATEEPEEVDNLGEDDNPPAPEEVETETDEEEEEAEPKPEPKKNKASLQKRINDALEKERLANERADRLEQRLAALEQTSKKEAPTLREQLPAEAPDPDAKDENGEAIYPLGEFDKQYIKDLTKFTVDSEVKAAQAAQAEAEQARNIQKAQQQLAQEWGDKVAAYEAENPEIRDNISALADTFQHLDPAYGDYLATAIMNSEVGPQIMDYFSQNIDEAQRIVFAGPVAATLAIGELQAKLRKSGEGETKPQKKVSQAPEPPEKGSRGSGGQFVVRGDTDNLDAFEKVFFQK